MIAFWDKWSGWIGNVILILGAVLLGEKVSYSFLLVFLGEAIWSLRAYKKREWDMLAICVLFSIIALLNYWKWS